jgi:CRP-like cAMP-binding protein
LTKEEGGIHPEGEVCGADDILLNRDRLHTYVALSDCLIYKLDRLNFNFMCAQHVAAKKELLDGALQRKKLQNEKSATQ